MVHKISLSLYSLKKNIFCGNWFFLNILSSIETRSVRIFFLSYFQKSISLWLKNKITVGNILKFQTKAEIKWKSHKNKKKNIKIFFKRWPVCRTKNQWKKHVFGSRWFKNKDLFKIKKKNNGFNQFGKFIDFFFENLISLPRKVQKTLFFVTSPKSIILVRKVL
jgi:hypothetical protein